MTINVGLIGIGNIGTGVAEYLRDYGVSHGLRLKAVADADPGKLKNASLPGTFLTDDASKVTKDPQIQIVIELIGGENPARQIKLDAIDNGKAVVTANKFTISRYSRQIFQAARSRGVDVRFEASVGGGIPIIQSLQEGLAPNAITLITGIVNGTTNYILTRMSEGMEYETALKTAQEKGFAERDPYLDVSGQDSKHKLAILASVAWNSWIDPASVPCEGISQITPGDMDFAAEFGYAIKLLATARKRSSKVELRVSPALVSVSHPLAKIADEFNAIYLDGNFCGPQMFYGRGAGRLATTSAVMADVMHIARNLRRGVRDELPSLDEKYELATDSVSGGYFRLDLKHVAGSLAKVADILARHGISIRDSVQRNKFKREVNGDIVVPDIITVEPVSDSRVKKALAELEECDSVYGKPFYLRIED
ncbi:MAG: homoserine dehydrogenase [Chloroflexi bacterium]|nr:homoserine dehydrogenase [Chloroflexota bacterium]